MTFLAIDVGNTRLKWALFDTPRPGATILQQGAEFLDNIDRLSDGEWAKLPQPSSMLGCIVASDSVRHRVEEEGRNHTRQHRPALHTSAYVSAYVSICSNHT